VRSNRVVDLFGKRLTLAAEHTHQYVTAIIKVRAKQVTINGEVVHDVSFAISRLP
jgi:hypothetical protein